MIDLIYRYDPRSTPLPPPASPAEARKRLCQGNQEFVGLVDTGDERTPTRRVIPFDLRDLGVAESAGVAPRQQLNAALTAKTLRHEFREADVDHLQVCYCVYHLVSREVNLPLDVGTNGHPMLYDPPADADAFRQLGLQLASSAEVRQMLDTL